MKNKWLGVLAVLIIGLLVSIPQGRAQEEDEGRYYVRVRHIKGEIEGEEEVYVQRFLETAPYLLQINEPLMAGDRIWTGLTRVELQFSNGTVVWLGQNTKIDLRSMSEIYLFTGNLAIKIFELDSEIAIDTSSASTYFLKEGFYRVDFNEDSTTILKARSGLAEMVAEGESVFVKDREIGGAGVIDGKFEIYKYTSYFEDEFDNWCYRRIPTLTRSSYTSSEIAYQSSELDNYGDWIVHSTYGRCWRPYPHLLVVDWRPYRYGRWIWMPCGWTWVGYEPWGWAPYHYGRWCWDPYWDCWIWAPDIYWSPAWVYWTVGPSHIGWCPMGYGRYEHYHHYYYDNNDNLDPDKWTVVPRKAIKSKQIRKEKFTKEQIKANVKANETQVYRPASKSRYAKPRGKIIRKDGIKAKDIKTLPRDIATRPYKDINKKDLSGKRKAHRDREYKPSDKRETPSKQRIEREDKSDRSKQKSRSTRPKQGRKTFKEKEKKDSSKSRESGKSVRERSKSGSEKSTSPSTKSKGSKTKTKKTKTNKTKSNKGKTNKTNKSNKSKTSKPKPKPEL